MTIRTSCSSCGSADLEMFLDLGWSPIADAYTATRDEESVTYPLQVAVCGKCRLVQLLEVLADSVLFGTGYSFYSSASPPLSAYHADYAADVKSYPALVERGVLEIGCNDGDLLRHFQGGPGKHLGIDPSVGPVDAARERGLVVWPASFTAALAQQVPSEFDGHNPGVIIANHVLAHVENVADFLAGVATLLADDGIAMIEVQYLPDLLLNNAFDLIYHEHRNFFSLTSLEAAAARHGLHVADAHLTPRQGGSIRVTLTSRAISEVPQVTAIKRSERWLDSFGAYEGMQGRAERIRWRLNSLLLEQDDVAVYGAAAKTTTLLNFCLPVSRMLPFCIDTTTAKQGRHIPGVGIPIVAPGERDAATYLLGAWNYLGPIMRDNPGHRWIVPIPAPVLVG